MNTDLSKTVPGLSGVLETAVYVDDLDKAEHFYARVLGLPKIFTQPGRLLAFRCEESILLVFNPTQTESEQIMVNGGIVPFHGTHGAGHVAFRVSDNEIEPWRNRLHSSGVKIESEVTWPNGARSIYFRDPAGNSLELATPNMWPFDKEQSNGSPITGL
jgi:catechol 2,3-dioxygenase-like lactoylglutathione lyase family enzyme